MSLIPEAHQQLEVEGDRSPTAAEVEEAEGANLPATTGGTEVAIPVEEQWVDLANAFDDGMGQFIDHFGLTMPRLRSDFGRNGKGWVDDLTKAAKSELNGVILAMPPSRTFWIKTLDEGGGGGEPPDCKSTDLLRDTPDPGVPAPQSEKCSTCPHSQFTEREDGSSERPRCSEAINVFFYDVDEESFCWLRFGGTAIKPFRNYVSALLARKKRPYQVITNIKLEEQSKGTFQWLAPHFVPAIELGPDEVRPWREMAQKAMATWGDVAEEMAGNEAAATAGVSPFPAGSTTEVDPNEEPF